jgi:hypothetical protein
MKTMVDIEGFTTDFTRFCKTPETVGTDYPTCFVSRSLSITENRVHNGDSTAEAQHYGIRAKLIPCRTRGVIYQLVESDSVVQYANMDGFTERVRYLEAWVVYPKKPPVYDYLTNERNQQGRAGYTTGTRTLHLTTWFVSGQNTTHLKQLGFSKDIGPANGLWATWDTDVSTPSFESIRRRVEFQWDYVNYDVFDAMWSQTVT